MKKRKHFAFNIWFSNMKLLSLAVGILLVVLILDHYNKRKSKKRRRKNCHRCKKI